MANEPSKREALQAAAQRAANQQPDEIHLTPVPGHAWSNATAVEDYAKQLHGIGFEEAGTYTIDALPVAVRFLLKEADRIYATIYEHAKAGVWMNFVILYANATSSTLTTTPNRGLEQRPGHPIVHSPGASPEELFALAVRHGRNVEERKRLAAATIPAEFEHAWKEGVAWRKSRGFSMAEIASVLLTRDGKAGRVLRPKRIQFAAEQDGAAEQQLKDALGQSFERHPSLERAHLLRVRYDDRPGTAVAVCLVGATATNGALVDEIRKAFAEQFSAMNELDIVFVPAAEVPRLEAAGRAFYVRDRPLH
jgi:hypothetical protein